VDANENIETAEGLMNLHNNEAGRRVSFNTINISTSLQGVLLSTENKKEQGLDSPYFMYKVAYIFVMSYALFK